MGVINDLRMLLRLRGFRRLFLTRAVSQAGDGAFQVGLATVLFFSPENAGTAAEIAGGFAIMFAPFVIAPFVGVLLDRWQRRQVLLWANLVRGLITAIGAAVMLAWGGTWVVAGIGLLALACNRFILSGLSAGLPLVLEEDAGDPEAGRALLLTANSIVPTLGAGAPFRGGGVGLALAFILPEGRGRDAAALGVGACLMLAAAACALRLRRTQLGPEHPAQTQIRQDVVVILRDMGQGARYLVARRTPGQGLLAMAVHRFLFGIVFIAAILISRNLLNPDNLDAGIATFATIVGLIGVGGGLAVVITPTISRYTGPQVWVALMLVLSAVSQAVLAWSYQRWVIMACAFLLGTAAQAAKIAVDTIVAKDSHDEFRGRAFAFYDLLFNLAFTGAAGFAALVVPDLGWSRELFGALAAAYLVAAAWVYFGAARAPRGLDLAKFQ
ncbi:MAG: MFS transporter [Promicromonosporaceae bacterium]|nr:MFS transporter [Promicromonosporaceae bacterium]